LWRGWIFLDHFSANLLVSVLVKEFRQSVNICYEFVTKIQSFLDHSVGYWNKQTEDEIKRVMPTQS